MTTLETCTSYVRNKELTFFCLVECLRRTCADVDGSEHGDPSWVHVDRRQHLHHSDFRAGYGGTREFLFLVPR